MKVNGEHEICKRYTTYGQYKQTSKFTLLHPQARIEMLGKVMEVESIPFIPIALK